MATKFSRRQLQREQNPLRAAEMHAARLDWEKHRLFPDESPDDSSILPQFNIGCSGWYYRHWHGGFYPLDLPNKDWFSFYAGKFDTVELNAPFYSWPKVATVKSWIRQARGHRLVYTVKVSELITHTKRFEGVKTLIRDFGHIANLLGPLMGSFLFQLPPSFRFTPARLSRIVAQLEPGRRNVVEFRHSSWWNVSVYSALREAGIIFCSCSAPNLPDDLIRTTDEVYIRFHGRTLWYRDDYPSEELATWAARIRDSGAKRVWAYFNNDFESNATRNAKDLERQLTR